MRKQGKLPVDLFLKMIKLCIKTTRMKNFFWFLIVAAFSCSGPTLQDRVEGSVKKYEESKEQDVKWEMIRFSSLAMDTIDNKMYYKITASAKENGMSVGGYMLDTATLEVVYTKNILTYKYEKVK